MPLPRFVREEASIPLLPTGPDAGSTLTIESVLELGDSAWYVNVTPPLGPAGVSTVTSTGPGGAVGAITLICPPLQEMVAAWIVPNVTVAGPCDAPKLEPEITTAVPAGPDAGEMPMM